MMRECNTFLDIITLLPTCIAIIVKYIYINNNKLSYTIYIPTEYDVAPRTYIPKGPLRVAQDFGKRSDYETINDEGKVTKLKWCLQSFAAFKIRS